MFMIAVLSYIILVVKNIQCEQKTSDTILEKYLPEDARLNFTGLGQKNGISINEYDVVTEDGYILIIFHVASGQTKRPPILLQHGILDSADTFIIRGNTSLVVTLALAGFDVWIGNTRGNKYGRRHTELDPNKDAEFWNYSVQENGFYDAAALIDFVLKKTGANKLTVIGHSQATAIFCILGSTRSEYNEKINVMVGLAPVVFLSHLPQILVDLFNSIVFIDNILPPDISPEVFGDDTFYKQFLKIFCSLKKWNYEICGRGIIFVLTGLDVNQLERDFLSTVIGHFPQSASRKSLVHWGRIVQRKIFARYDYGNARNVEVYDAESPPPYDLNKVTMKVALYAGRNDNLSRLKDVELLKKKLPNVVEFVVMRPSKWNHIDWIWGLDMDKYFYPYLLSLLHEYS